MPVYLDSTCPPGDNTLLLDSLLLPAVLQAVQEGKTDYIMNLSSVQRCGRTGRPSPLWFFCALGEYPTRPVKEERAFWNFPSLPDLLFFVTVLIIMKWILYWFSYSLWGRSNWKGTPLTWDIKYSSLSLPCFLTCFLLTHYGLLSHEAVWKQPSW